MARGGSENIEAIKARLNIVDIVRRYVDLRQVGDRWAGVCPFHQETKPSLSVHPEKGFYYCFGCQASGDLIDFYRDINGLEFRQALEELAREAGVSLNERPDPKAAQRQAERRAALEMHSLAQQFFQATLEAAAGKRAREYLAARGVDRAMQDYFGLGFAPESWQALGDELQRSGYTLQQGVTAGLLSQNRNGRIYDRFRNRVTFPIHDLGGKVIAFGGRVIGEGEPKYLNSSDSPIYKKGGHLYGLYQARQAVTQSKEVLLTEGYADVIALVRYGFTHACGVLGTALTEEQVRRLAGLARRVTLIYDGDRAGRQAASRSAEMLLRQGVQCRVVNLPDGEDVDSLLQNSGAAGFQRFVREAEEGLTFCLRVLR
ncbi:MAG: DNA primase, partial [Desulfohalobium sp.]